MGFVGSPRRVERGDTPRHPKGINPPPDGRVFRVQIIDAGIHTVVVLGWLKGGSGLSETPRLSPPPSE